VFCLACSEKIRTVWAGATDERVPLVDSRFFAMHLFIAGMTADLAQSAL